MWEIIWRKKLILTFLQRIVKKVNFKTLYFERITNTGDVGEYRGGSGIFSMFGEELVLAHDVNFLSKCGLVIKKNIPLSPECSARIKDYI